MKWQIRKINFNCTVEIPSGKSKQSALDRSKDPQILKHLLDVAGAENRVEVVTVGLMARRRYFVKQGNLLSPTLLLRRVLGDRDGYVSKELGLCSLSTFRIHVITRNGSLEMCPCIFIFFTNTEWCILIYTLTNRC